MPEQLVIEHLETRYNTDYNDVKQKHEKLKSMMDGAFLKTTEEKGKLGNYINGYINDKASSIMNCKVLGIKDKGENICVSTRMMIQLSFDSENKEDEIKAFEYEFSLKKKGLTDYATNDIKTLREGKVHGENEES